MTMQVPQMALLAERKGSSHKINKTLAESTFFSGLDEDELGMLSYWFKVYQAPAGATLMQEGEDRVFLLILISGSIGVFKKVDDENEHVQVAEIPPGGSLGEMSLIDGKPISATAIATSDAEVLLIDSDDFHKVIKKNCNLGNHFLMVIARILSHRLRAATSLLADTLSQHPR